MDQQPTIDLKAYSRTYRLLYLAFFLSTVPFVIEAVVNYGGHPSRFIGDLYYAPFWIGWGSIALVACVVAMVIDTIRAQGMCISLVGIFYVGRLFLNIFDRNDSERFLWIANWAGWLLVLLVVSYHLAVVRPSVTHLYLYHRNRVQLYREAKRYLREQERSGSPEAAAENDA